VLVDSSVWIDFLRGDTSPEAALLVRALERADPIWIAPPILQEVLQGADNAARFARWDRTLGELPLVTEPDPRSLAREAANLYARCCWRGVTPRSANDCLITLYAVRADLPLLHRDRDFLAIAALEPRLRLLSPTAS